MKFGVNMFIWTAEFGESDLRLLPTIKERGFDGIEIPIFNPTTFPAAQIRRALQENGLETTICSVIPNGLGVIADDANVRAQTIAHLEASIARAAEVGARVFAGPLYSPVGYLPGRRRTPDEWKRAVEGFQTLGPALAQHNVTIAIEPLNRFETYFLNTAADAVALVREIGHPNVGLLVDTFHANIEEKSIAGAIRGCADVLCHVHISENDRSTPGLGNVRWAENFDTLREVNYNGWLMIEAFGLALPELAAATKIWRRMYQSEEQLAHDGLKFMQEQVAQRWK